MRLELKIPPLAQAVCVASAMWLLARIGSPVETSIPGRRAISVVLVIAGTLLAVTAVIRFRAARTTVDPRDPESANEIVTVGVYRWSRNPMYLGMLLVLLGWAVYLGHPLAVVPLPLFVLYMNRFQIEPEERALTKKFGESYATYMASVRRWI